MKIRLLIIIGVIAFTFLLVGYINGFYKSPDAPDPQNNNAPKKYVVGLEKLRSADLPIVMSFVSPDGIYLKLKINHNLTNLDTSIRAIIGNDIPYSLEFGDYGHSTDMLENIETSQGNHTVVYEPKIDDLIFTSLLTRPEHIPCDLPPSPGDNYFRYQCEWIEKPRVVAYSSMFLFAQIHNQIFLEVTTLKTNSGIHEFKFTSYDKENIERLVINQKIKDNTSISITLFNGTINNPTLVATGANNVIYYLKNQRNTLEASETVGKTIIEFKSPLEKYDIDTFLQLRSDNQDPAKEKIIRLKQSLLGNKLAAEFRAFNQNDTSIPISTIGYDGINNSLEITIVPTFFTEENIPKYVQKIKEIVGNEINILLYPRPYPIAQ